MSIMKREIVASVRSVLKSGNGNGEHEATFVFDEEFVGFQGHFPERKILPGICQIMCVTIVMEGWKKKWLSIEEVRKVKYFLPVEPGDELTCKCVIASSSNDNFTVKAILSKGLDKVSDMSLVFSYINSLKGKTDVATAEQMLF